MRTRHNYLPFAQASAFLFSTLAVEAGDYLEKGQIGYLIRARANNEE